MSEPMRGAAPHEAGSKPKLKAAVVGVGALGRWHAQKYTMLEGVELHAVADVDAQRAQEVAAQYGVHGVTDFRELLSGVDLVSIVVPTESHYDVAQACL